MRVYPFNFFDNADLSQPTLTSDVCDLNHIYGFSVHLIYTGTATGNIAVQASCDFTDFNLTSRIVNWTTIATIAIAAPGSSIYNADAAYYRWVRIVYTRTGGTGALIANLNAKG